jgi:hypothetical protein
MKTTTIPTMKKITTKIITTPSTKKKKKTHLQN